MDNIKNITLSSIIIEDEIIISLTGFYVFTGNDYISLFYTKRKDSML